MSNEVKVLKNSESETSLDRKLKYFYMPYNKGTNFYKSMRFDADDSDRFSTDITPSAKPKHRRSKWRRISRIIFNEDKKFFKNIGRDFKLVKEQIELAQNIHGHNRRSATSKKSLKQGSSQNIILSVDKIDEVSENNDTVENEEFSTYFQRLVSTFHQKKNSPKLVFKKRMNTLKKPSIFVNKISCNLEKYKSTKMDTLAMLDDIDEVSPNDLSVVQSAKLKPEKRRRPRLFSAQNRLQYDDNLTFGLSEEKIRHENLISMIAQRPTFVDTTIEKTKKKRVFKPVDKLKLAYSPNLVPRMFRLKHQTVKVHKKIRVSALSPDPVIVKNLNFSNEQDKNVSCGVINDNRLLRPRFKSGIVSPLFLNPSKRHKPSSTTVTTQYSSNIDPRSSKSIIRLKADL